jgi:hypothetical protein
MHIKILLRKPEGQKSFGRPKCRKKGNMKKDLGEMRCEDLDCIHLAQHTVQSQPNLNIRCSQRNINTQ